MLLHRGHLPAPSNETGLVKCFRYWHSLHFHRIEYSSCDCPICANAFIVVSRIASRAAFSVLSAGSINPAPSVKADPHAQQFCLKIRAAQPTLTWTSGMTPKRVWQPSGGEPRCLERERKFPPMCGEITHRTKISAGEVANRRPDGLAVFVLPRFPHVTARGKT